MNVVGGHIQLWIRSPTEAAKGVWKRTIGFKRQRAATNDEVDRLMRRSDSRQESERAEF